MSWAISYVSCGWVCSFVDVCNFSVKQLNYLCNFPVIQSKMIGCDTYVFFLNGDFWNLRSVLMEAEVSEIFIETLCNRMWFNEIIIFLLNKWVVRNTFPSWVLQTHTHILWTCRIILILILFYLENSNTLNVANILKMSN